MLFFATFITALILSFNAVADIDAFRIVGAEVSARDTGVSGDVTNYDTDTIESDTVFHHVGDTITYNLSVKNQHDKKYKIITITDDNNNPSILYNYDKHEGEEVAGGASFDLVVTAEYASGVASLNDRAQHLSVRFTITYEEVTNPDPDPTPTPTPSDEGESGNPNTSDRLPVYIAVLVISSIGLIVCIWRAGHDHSERKKHYNGRKLIVCLLIASALIPVAAKALTEASEFILATDYEFMDRVAVTIEVDGTESVIPAAYGSTIGALPTPSKDNYEFVGWKNESGDPLPDTTVLTEDTKLIAEFGEKKITVTFNANGGTPVTSTAEVRVNTALGDNIPADPIYENQLFDGWFTAADGGDKINASTTVGETNVEYFAHWTADISNATVTASETTLNHDVDDEKSATITVSGDNLESYTITSSDDETVSVNGTTITGLKPGSATVTITGGRSGKTQTISITVSSVMRKVTFDANGGTPATTEKQVRINTALGDNIPADPIYENHLFDGWFTAADGGSKIDADTEIGETNITYYAHWTADISNATVSSTSTTLNYDVDDEKSATITVSGDNLEPYTITSSDDETVSVDGATITGLKSGSATITITGSKSGKTQTIEITVNSVMRKVTFNANGGTPATTEKQVRINTALGDNIPADPVYENHLFDGWFTAADGGSEIDASTEIGETDVEYFAHWTGKVTLAELAASSFSIYDDETATIVVNNSSAIEEYAFSSLDESIATVNSATGEITGVSEGTTKIKMTGARSHEYIEIDVEIKRSLMVVTFKYQDGVTADTTAQIRIGSKIGDNRPGYPARQGYYPTGWYTGDTGGTLITYNTVINNDVAFYLHWVKDVTLAEVANVTNDHFDLYDDETIDFIVTNADEVEVYNIDSSNASVANIITEVDPETGEITSVEIVANGVGDANITMTGLLSEEQRVFTVTVITSNFTVNFDSTGGSEVASRTVHRNTAVGELPEDPVWPGYTFDGWFTAADDSGEQVTSATVISENPTTFYAHWTQKPVLCKKATELHTQVCSRSDNEGCHSAGKYDIGETVTYGNIASDTPVPGDAYDCDMNGDGVYNASDERFYYLRNIGDNAVLIFHANYGTGGINHNDIVAFDEAYGKLPTTTDWPNAAVEFDGKPARLASLEDIAVGCGSSISVSACEYLLEHTSFTTTVKDEGRTAVWLQRIDDDTTLRYRGDDFGFNTNANTSGVRPTIEVPLYLLEESYMVSYDANGGTVSGQQHQSIAHGDAITSLPTATKKDANDKNYIMVGWFTSKIDGDKIEIGEVPSGDVTYYAHYAKSIAQATIVNENMTINVDDTDHIEISDLAEVGEELSFSVVSGSEFASVDSNGDVVGLGVGTAEIQIHGETSGYDRTVTAHIVEPRDYFIVTFDTHGGDTIGEKHIAKNTAIGDQLPSSAGTISGQTFYKWYASYTDGVYSAPVDASTVVAGDVTYHARWLPNGAVAIDSNNVVYVPTDEHPTDLETLRAAVGIDSTGVPDGGTVTLLKDISGALYICSKISCPASNPSNMTKSLTLDLDGHTMSATNSNVIRYAGSGVLEVKNGKVTSNASSGAINVETAGSNMIINGLSIIARGTKQAVWNNGGDLTIKGGATIEHSGNQRAAVHNLAGGTTTILDATIYAKSYSAVRNDGGTVIIGKKDGTVDISTPVIRSDTYGIDFSGDSVSVKFYDGIIMGKTAAMQDEAKIIETERGTEKAYGTEVIDSKTYNTLYLVGGSDDPESSDEIKLHNITSSAVQEYYDKIDEWNANQKTSLWPALKQNFDSHKCLITSGDLDSPGFEFQYESDGSNGFCSTSVAYDTGVSGAVNVYLYDEGTETLGDQVFYTKSESGKIYNMVPDQTYYWEKADDPLVYGYVKAETVAGKRFITAGGLSNVRDLGGMSVDYDDDGVIDGTIKYGRLLRGEELKNDASAAADLKAILGANNAEFDLRGSSTSDPKLDTYYGQDGVANYDIGFDGTNYRNTRAAVADIMRAIVDDQKNIFFHCRVGSDRTGTVAYILEGLLGVDNKTRDEEYELTTFSGRADRNRYYENKGDNYKRYAYMTSKSNVSEGLGLVDNDDIYEWFMLGSTDTVADEQLISDFRDAMIEKPLIAKAILGDNNNLNFVYDRLTYAPGDSYMDNTGTETVITNVYNDIPLDRMGEDGTYRALPWSSQYESISTINFDDSFASARPTSTAQWFEGLTKLSTITNHDNLNTSQVVDMQQMFCNAGHDVTSFSLDLSGWNTTNVKNMYYMFDSAGYNATTWNINGLSSWDVSGVSNMESMFSSAGLHATTIDIDLHGWTISSAKSLSGMFTSFGLHATTFNPNLKDWDVNGVTDISNMFFSAGSATSSFNLDLSSWKNTGKVTNMGYAFYLNGEDATTFKIDLSGWNTGKVTNMERMFVDAGRDASDSWEIAGLNSWNTSKVTNMSYMFNNAGHSAPTFEFDFSGWNTSNVKYMTSMFSSAGYDATTWSVGDISGWNVSQVQDIPRLKYFINIDQANIDKTKLPWRN